MDPNSAIRGWGSELEVDRYSTESQIGSDDLEAQAPRPKTTAATVQARQPVTTPRQSELVNDLLRKVWTGKVANPPSPGARRPRTTASLPQGPVAVHEDKLRHLHLLDARKVRSELKPPFAMYGTAANTKLTGVAKKTHNIRATGGVYAGALTTAIRKGLLGGKIFLQDNNRKRLLAVSQGQSSKFGDAEVIEVETGALVSPRSHREVTFKGPITDVPAGSHVNRTATRSPSPRRAVKIHHMGTDPVVQLGTCCCCCVQACPCMPKPQPTRNRTHASPRHRFRKALVLEQELDDEDDEDEDEGEKKSFSSNESPIPIPRAAARVLPQGRYDRHVLREQLIAQDLDTSVPVQDEPQLSQGQTLPHAVHKGHLRKPGWADKVDFRDMSVAERLMGEAKSRHSCWSTEYKVGVA